MDRIRLGRWIMTAVIASTTALSFVLDWSANHLLNPAWHPHAQFHGALLLFMLAGVTATSVYLLWRESEEPEIMVRAVAFLSIAFWTPLFYITTLLPKSTSWAGAPESDPRLSGSFVTPNLAVAMLFVLLSAFSIYLSRRVQPKRSRADTEGLRNMRTTT